MIEVIVLLRIVGCNWTKRSLRKFVFHCRNKRFTYQVFQAFYSKCKFIQIGINKQEV